MLRPRGTCHRTAPTLPSPNGGRVLTYLAAARRSLTAAQFTVFHQAAT
jgi:hypothetical protein